MPPRKKPETHSGKDHAAFEEMAGGAMYGDAQSEALKIAAAAKIEGGKKELARKFGAGLPKKRMNELLGIHEDAMNACYRKSVTKVIMPQLKKIAMARTKAKNKVKLQNTQAGLAGIRDVLALRHEEATRLKRSLEREEYKKAERLAELCQHLMMGIDISIEHPERAEKLIDFIDTVNEQMKKAKQAKK